MKEKILVFTIGLLVGAIITACGFLIYMKVANVEIYEHPPQVTDNSEGRSFNRKSMQNNEGRKTGKDEYSR